MQIKTAQFITLIFLMSASASCSKKVHPGEHTSGSKNVHGNTGTVSGTIKVVKTPVPKVISVNDKAASKTFDGRYYYDLEGRRYWRNNKDGKYYLYNKSMQGNPDFK